MLFCILDQKTILNIATCNTLSDIIKATPNQVYWYIEGEISSTVLLSPRNFEHTGKMNFS